MQRRSLLLGLGAATMATAAPRAALAAAPRFDANDAEQASLIFRKLAYGLAGEVSFWWMRGVRYGVQENVATPFWEMHTASWYTTRDLGDGQYEVRSAASNLYTPLGSTALLERFANPYTSETLDVPYATPKLSVVVYDRHHERVTPVPVPPGATASRQEKKGPPFVVGDEVIVRADSQFRIVATDPARAPFTVQDWTTYVGNLAEVLNPRKRNPSASMSFTDVLSFPPWLKMSDRPGSFVSRCYGRKVRAYADMPAV